MTLICIGIITVTIVSTALLSRPTLTLIAILQNYKLLQTFGDVLKVLNYLSTLILCYTTCSKKI